jgi:large subunit ribosomal protein L19
MNTEIISLLATQKKDFPDFKPGDTVRVTSKTYENDVERIQHFEGIVIKRRGSNLNETFTVRKISFGIGVERTFHLHSPNIIKIELIKKGKLKDAKLYYLRKSISKSITVEKEITKEQFSIQQ